MVEPEDRRSGRFRYTGDQHDPRDRDGRATRSPQWPSGHGDVARPARPCAVHQGHEVRASRPTGPTGTASSLGRARLDPAVRHAAPRRVRPHARRSQGLPPVGLGDTGTPRSRAHRRCRGHDRSARPGRGQCRGHGDRRVAVAHPVRRRPVRSPCLRHRRRRMPLGGISHEAASLAGTWPRQARDDLRRQSHHDRRRDRSGVERRRRSALPLLWLARSRARRGRGRSRCARGRAQRGQGGHRRAVARHRAHDHRNPGDRVRRHPRGTRLRHPRRGDRRHQSGDGHARRRDLPRAL